MNEGIEHNIKETLMKVNNLLNYYLDNPDEDMSELELEVTKLYDYIDLSPNKTDLPIKNDLKNLLVKVEKLALRFKQNQKQILDELNRLNINNQGHKKYTKYSKLVESD